MKEYALVLIKSLNNHMCFVSLNGETVNLNNYKTPNLKEVELLKESLERSLGNKYLIIEVKEK